MHYSVAQIRLPWSSVKKHNVLKKTVYLFNSKSFECCQNLETEYSNNWNTKTEYLLQSGTLIQTHWTNRSLVRTEQKENSYSQSIYKATNTSQGIRINYQHINNSRFGNGSTEFIGVKKLDYQDIYSAQGQVKSIEQLKDTFSNLISHAVKWTYNTGTVSEYYTHYNAQNKIIEKGSSSQFKKVEYGLFQTLHKTYSRSSNTLDIILIEDTIPFYISNPQLFDFYTEYFQLDLYLTPLREFKKRITSVKDSNLNVLKHQKAIQLSSSALKYEVSYISKQLANHHGMDRKYSIFYYPNNLMWYKKNYYHHDGEQYLIFYYEYTYKDSGLVRDIPNCLTPYFSPYSVCKYYDFRGLEYLPSFFENSTEIEPKKFDTTENLVGKNVQVFAITGQKMGVIQNFNPNTTSKRWHPGMYLLHNESKSLPIQKYILTPQEYG